MYLAELPAMNAIKIRGLIHKPSADFVGIISRSVQLIALQSDAHPEYIGFSGSCSLLKTHGCLFVSCTRHQLGVKAAEQPGKELLEAVRVPQNYNRIQLKNIPLGMCYFETSSKDEEYHDCLVFAVDKSWESIARESPYFFDLSPNVTSDKRHASWAIGCSNSRTKMQYEPSHLHVVTMGIGCIKDNHYQSNAQFSSRYQYKDEGQNLDGISGGAIFSLIGETGHWEIVFEGLILRAGKGSIYCLDRSYINDMINQLSA
jgi:hypothetical protein